MFCDEYGLFGWYGIFGWYGYNKYILFNIWLLNMDIILLSLFYYDNIFIIQYKCNLIYVLFNVNII